MVPNGNLESFYLREDLARSVKIGVDLPLEVRAALIEFLQDNADLFAITPYEIPDIDPSIMCYLLNMDAKALYVSQRWRRHSPEKAEATGRIVKGLLETQLIYEAKYTKWISNIVLEKKELGKWRMCIDYTNLDRAYSKDSYFPLNIDKLVDNSVRY